jgi:tRNA1Val (adenine37-N6)-methyltransferase
VETNQTDESINGLFRNKVRVIQALRGYRVSEDAIILTWFTRPKPRECILDAGTGCGVIAFGLAVREPSVSVIGLEIQKDLAGRAGRGVKLNKLESRVVIIRGDLRKADRFFRHGSFDAVVSNPPYNEPGRGRINLHHEKALSRHQLMMPLGDLFLIAERILRPLGRLSLIYPAAGVDRIYKALKETGFKLSRMLWIHPYEGAEPGHVCIESLLDQSVQELIEDHLYLYHGHHERTQEAEAILGGDEISTR